jgi:alkyl sulfatase BDS1-like metallo-beta-lactamase superfamily hydrolase
LIQKTGEEHTIDGVRIIFQMVPGTEAPAEINFHFPGFRALCIPETATNCMHNIVTLRGAQVRDASAWSRYLDEAIVLFGNRSDVLFGSHNWPTWGREELLRRLEEQRDLYGFMHDQTVRLMNLGMTGTEIAEVIQLPEALERAWHCRGFYGSLSHNVKVRLALC